MAETKYHIGDDGAPSICVARSAETCPKSKSGDDFHGDLETAQAEAERRFELSYGAFSTRTGPVTVALDEKGQEITEYLLENCDPRKLIAAGKAIREQDYIDFHNSILEIDQLVREGKITGRNTLDNPERTPYPPNFAEFSLEEKKEFERKRRLENEASRRRVGVLEDLYKKTPNRAVGMMLAYHKGESDEWPVYYNHGYDEQDVVRSISRYSDEQFNESVSYVEQLKNGKGSFTLKKMEGESLEKLKNNVKARGLVLEEAVSIDPDPRLAAEQINFSFANGVEPHTGRELLYHGTGAGNLLGILNGGFNKSKGTFSSGAFSGEGYYFSSDAAVAADFSPVGKERSGYIVLCEVVTGGPERTQKKAMNTGIRGRKYSDMAKLPKTLGKDPSGKLPNLARKLTITIKDRLNPGPHEPYEETFVKDARQIRPVALIKVSGTTRARL